MDRKSWRENKRVIISPFGGHGTVFILGRFSSLLRRPDVAFGLDCDCTQYPVRADRMQWLRRSGQQLDYSLTIEENIVNLIMQRKTFLSGCCSAIKPFLTRNNVRATCIVRHPLHAYVSFMNNRHPNHAMRFGGFNTGGAVQWWSARWKNIIDDFISSGNAILRYEYLQEDDKAGTFARLYSKWDGTHRNDGLLRGHLETKLKLAVEDRFYKLYDEWEM